MLFILPMPSAEAALSPTTNISGQLHGMSEFLLWTELSTSRKHVLLEFQGQDELGTNHGMTSCDSAGSLFQFQGFSDL